MIEARANVIDHRRDVIGRAVPRVCVRGSRWMDADGGSWLLTSKHAGAEAKARAGSVIFLGLIIKHYCFDKDRLY